MRLIIILSLSLFFYTSVKSQTVFNKLLIDTMKVISTDMAKLNNNYYIVASYNDGTRGARIKKLDLNGNMLNEIIFHNPTKTLYEAVKTALVINNKKQLIFLTSPYEYLTDSEYVSLSCLDTNLNLIWEKTYLSDTLDNVLSDIIQTKDSGYAIVGARYTANKRYDGFLLKTDSLGNQQWVKYYGSSFTDDITNIVETDNGYMLAGESRQFNQYYGDWYIVRTDTAGNQIWSWILINPDLHDFWVKDLIQTQDGNFIAVGGKTYGMAYGSAFMDARLLKFDINKNIILDTLYKEPMYDPNLPADWNTNSRFDRITELDNGNLLATCFSFYLDNKWIHTTKLYELSPNGQVLKRRQFHSTPYGDGFGSCDTMLRFEFVPVPKRKQKNECRT